MALDVTLDQGIIDTYQNYWVTAEAIDAAALLKIRRRKPTAI
jgi:mannose/cellobiose epimerase-like protein (N-acyl-D-glucosamine 2-epimerase family)